MGTGNKLENSYHIVTINISLYSIQLQNHSGDVQATVMRATEIVNGINSVSKHGVYTLLSAWWLNPCSTSQTLAFMWFYHKSSRGQMGIKSQLLQIQQHCWTIFLATNPALLCITMQPSYSRKKCTLCVELKLHLLATKWKNVSLTLHLVNNIIVHRK